MKTFIITGGAGFIGSAVIKYLLTQTSYRVINVDKLTYAGNLLSLADVEKHDRYHFVLADICDRAKMQQTFEKYKPSYVMHLAAESHVDRSINGSSDFIQTNIIGTYTLLEVARLYWRTMPNNQQASFRFHHISTDEVYGDLTDTTSLFTENSAYKPSSPYSASKASSDHLVRAWQRTYDLPTVITNCSNNYGAFQFPEKLIPVIILNALEGKELPIYGNGKQIRDWLFVDDHAKALVKVATEGVAGETYNIGGHNEKTNIEVVKAICNILDEIIIDKPNGVVSFSELITFVTDRPGHDLRYAVDASKIQLALGWKPQETFESGIRKTVMWFVNNQSWCQQVQQATSPEKN